MGFTVDIPTSQNISNTEVRRDGNSSFGVNTVIGNLQGNATSADDGIVAVTGSNGLTLILDNKVITGEINPDTLNGSKILFYENGTEIGQEAALNLIAGSNVSLSAVNNIGANRIDVTITVNLPTVLNIPIVSEGVEDDIVVLDSSGFARDSGIKLSDIQDKNFIYQQLSASNLWTVNHNLGKFPSVTVVDSGGTMVIGDIVYVNTNSLTISFSTAFAGVAYIN